MLFDDEYRKVKDETLNLVLDSFEKPKEKKLTPTDIEREYKKRMVKNNLDMPTKELAKALDVSERTIQDYRKEIKEDLREKALLTMVINENKSNFLVN